MIRSPRNALFTPEWGSQLTARAGNCQRGTPRKVAHELEFTPRRVKGESKAKLLLFHLGLFRELNRPICLWLLGTGKSRCQQHNALPPGSSEMALSPHTEPEIHQSSALLTPGHRDEWKLTLLHTSSAVPSSGKPESWLWKQRTKQGFWMSHCLAPIVALSPSTISYDFTS